MVKGRAVFSMLNGLFTTLVHPGLYTLFILLKGTSHPALSTLFNLLRGTSLYILLKGVYILLKGASHRGLST